YEIRGKVADITSDTWPGLYLSSQIESLSGDTAGILYEHVNTSDPAEKRQLDAELASNQSNIDDTARQYEKTIFLPADRQIFTSLMNARTACQTAYKPALDLSRNGKVAEAQALLRQQVDPACKEFKKWSHAEVLDNKNGGEESNQRILNAVSQAELV